MQNHQYVPVCMCVYAQSCLVGTPWTVAHQAPLSMEFPREEYWSVLLAFPPWDLPLRDQTHISCVSCIDRQTVCHWCHLGNPNVPQFSSVQFSHSVVSDSLRPHELQHARPPCLSPTLRVHSNSCPSSR